MKDSFKQLRTLIWEHLKLRRRHFILTLLEVCLPILIFLIALCIRSNHSSFNKEHIPTSSSYVVSNSELLRNINNDTKFFYCPRTNFTSNLAESVQLKLDLNKEEIKGFDSKQDLLLHYKNTSTDGTTVVVNFDDVNQEIPENLKYDLQMYEEKIDWQTDTLFSDSSSGGASHRYLENHFLTFQWALDISYIEILTKTPLDVTINFQEFPNPSHWVNNDDIFMHLLPPLVVLSYIFLFPSILKVIVEEKTSKMKQLMKINGLKSRVYWLGWFFNSCTPCVISAVIISVLLTQKFFIAEYPFLQHVSMFQLTCLIILYCVATITYIFFLSDILEVVKSNILESTTLTIFIGMIIWFLSYTMYAAAAETMKVMPLSLKLIASLMPPIALYNGFEVISVGEVRGTSVGFTEQPRGGSDDMTMLMTFIMLAISTILHAFISLCTETNSHGKYRIVKFANKIFLPKRNTSNNVDEEQQLNVFDEHSPGTPILQIKNLTKMFDGYKVIDNISLDIYDGNLTVILGHNGAGKTILLSILAGLEKETSGEVIFNEKTNTSNRKNRQLVSICPQEDMFFSELTVEEHLVFFGKLKGFSDDKIRRHVEYLLKEKLKLDEKRNNLIKTLSGGMKRKLSIGIAIMGKPKLVILDEPTAAIDPEGRRDVWNFILECKRDSNIILTTQLMEEAEKLADRVAILCNGELKCYQPLQSYKKELEFTYRIDIFYQDPTETEKIKTFLNTKIDAKIDAKKDDKNKEITSVQKIECSIKKEQQHRISWFLNEIDKSNLSITNYEIYSTTLEGVFLRYFEGPFLNKDQSRRRASYQESNRRIENNTHYWKDLFNKFVCTTKMKFKILRSMAFPWLTAIAFFYLLFFLTFAMNSGNKNFNRDGKTLPLQLNQYGRTNAYYQINSAEERKIESIYEHLIKSWQSSPHKVENITEAVIDVGANDIVDYRQKLIVGAKIVFKENEKEITVMYGTQAIHGAPISLNLITNLLTKYFSGENHAIIASHTPLQYPKYVEDHMEINIPDNLIYWMILLPHACLFSVIVFSALPTLETNTFIKTLSRIYNLPSYSYWLFNYLTDIIIYLMIIILPIIILVIFSDKNPILLQMGGVGPLVLILLWYGITMIPYTYLMSFSSKSILNTALIILLVKMFLSPILAGIIMLTESVDSLLVISILILVICSIVSPHVIFTYTLSNLCLKLIANHNWDIKSKTEKEDSCRNRPLPCCDPESVECSNDRAYIPNPIFFIISFLVALILIACSIYWDRNRKWKIREEEKVVIGAEELTKTYRRNKCCRVLQWLSKLKDEKCCVCPHKKNETNKPAVEDLSFKVSKGECFGLLGVSGAGKSTVYKILTKQRQSDAGEILISDIKVPPSIGYCPQQHVIINHLTGRELLSYFGKLRNPNIGEEDVDELLSMCGLDEYSDRPCRIYSGGYRRLLNTCIALIGSPDIILLDEPTTGVDPINRKKIKDLILKTKAKGNSGIVFTSHNMDECEEICDSLSIMKAGKVKTGECRTIQQLKEECNIGHVVQIKVNYDPNSDPNYRDILKALINSLPEAHIEVINARRTLLIISIKNSNWKSILEKVEEIKAKHNDIIDYLVKEPSLDEVFLKVAKSR